MALGKTKITGRGYQKVYTVPAGKRATVSSVAYANAASTMALAALPSNQLANDDVNLSAVPFDGINDTQNLDAGNLALLPTTTGFNAAASVLTVNGDASNNQLGYAVALDGDYAVLGYGVGGVLGKVLIYFYDGTAWTLQQTLTDPANNPNSTYGSAVAISGDNIIVGAFDDDTQATNNGRAYRYTRSGTTWSLAATFTNPNGGASDTFGRSVAIAGDFIVIGSDGFSAGGAIGRAYGYRVSTGNTLQVTFTNPTGGNNDRYGFSVACWSDGRVLVGAYANPSGSNTGRAYYYGAFVNTLTANIANPNNNQDKFGYTVACDKTGTFFAIGAEGFNGNSNTGRVYTYSTATPTSVLQDIANPTAQTNSNFGTGLAMDSAGNLLVGSYLFNDAVVDQGRAYLYTRSGTAWTLIETIDNPAPASSDQFGFGVAISLGGANSATTYTQNYTVTGNPRPFVYTYRGVSVTVNQTLSSGSRSVSAPNRNMLIGAYLDDSGALSNNGSVQFRTATAITVPTTTIAATALTQQTLPPATQTAINTQIDDFLLLPDSTLDKLALAVAQTFERTGLVLDAGDTIVISLPDDAGDVTIQVRGFEETV